VCVCVCVCVFLFIYLFILQGFSDAMSYLQGDVKNRCCVHQGMYSADCTRCCTTESHQQLIYIVFSSFILVCL
jgi:hypothetical protein